MLPQGLSNSGTALIISDQEGRYLFSNETNDKLMGAKPHQLLDRNWRDFVSPHEVERISRFEAQAFEGRPVGYNVMARREDGALVPMNINLSRLGGRRGNVLIVTCRPVIGQRDLRQDIASYVADMAMQLSAIAAQSEFGLLATHLRAAASVAGEELEKLGGLVPEIAH